VCALAGNLGNAGSVGKVATRASKMATIGNFLEQSAYVGCPLLGLSLKGSLWFRG
jgi:hypothetical protein